MKFTIVPAQVTSVEDRIAGNLSVVQMGLLALPVFGGSLLYAILPPFMSGSWYKYVLLGLIAVISGLLAIRIKGKILLSWIIVIYKYNRRPSFYVYDKRTLAGRERIGPPVVPKSVRKQTTKRTERQVVSSDDAAKLMKLVDRPESNLRFEVNKKGGLYVRYTQIED